MNEKCSVCGREASLIIDVHSIGFTKHMAYCKDCLRNAIRNSGKRKLRSDIDKWTLFNSKPRLQMNVDFSEIDSFNLLNDSLKRTFGRELGNEERIRYKLSRLRGKMKKAIQNENYELAGILKREIDQLESNFKKTR